LRVLGSGLAIAAVIIALGVAPRAQPVPAGEVRALYIEHCSKCHGTNGTPKPIARGAPRFTDPEWTIPIEQIVATITTGKGDEMPRFRRKLTEEQIQVLAKYVLSFRDAEKPPG
jgi:mono/diheme cytochrome c family protein